MGERLKQLREKNNLTADELASKLDIPLGCLKDAEQDKRELDLSLIKKVCGITGVSADYFGLTPEQVGDKPMNQLAYLSGSVGRKIRKLRDERSLTLVDLGRKAGISYTHISEIERGNTCPSLKTITKLANVLDLPVTYFFTEQDGQSSDVPVDRERVIKRPEGIIEEIKVLTQGETEFVGRFLDLLKQFRREDAIEDILTLKINETMQEMTDEQKQAVLDYAKFIKSKSEEPASG